MWRRAVLVVVTLALAFATPQPAYVETWPRGGEVSCRWDRETETLGVSWPEAIGPPPARQAADLYEINIASTPLGRASAVHLTGNLSASLGLDDLLPETTYYLSLRAHAGWAFATGHMMGADTWGMLGPATACATGLGRSAARAPESSSASGVVAFESWRISEYTNTPDYLLNHDGADVGGSSLLVTIFGQLEFYEGELALRDSWTGGSTADMAITVYCVDALPPPTPGNDTARSLVFADYLSCNNQADHSTSQCSCAVAMDRLWGRLPIDRPRCFQWVNPNVSCGGSATNCTCVCSPAETAESDAYTGVMHVFSKDEARAVGRWFSHPIDGACKEHQLPGEGGCTWSMGRNTARVIHGDELYKLGLNASALTCDLGNVTGGIGPECAPTAAQIRQNAAVMRAALDAAPLAKWTCGA